MNAENLEEDAAAQPSLWTERAVWFCATAELYTQHRAVEAEAEAETRCLPSSG